MRPHKLPLDNQAPYDVPLMLRLLDDLVQQNVAAPVTYAQLLALPKTGADPLLDGAVRLVTDIGTTPVVFRYNAPAGRWRAQGGAFIRTRDSVLTPITGTISRTLVKSVTIPAGLLGPNGRVEMDFRLRCAALTAAAKGIAVEINGTSVGSAGSALTNNLLASCNLRMSNVGSVSAQVVSMFSLLSPYGSSAGGSLWDGTINTDTTDLTISLYITPGATTDSITAPEIDVRIVTA